MELQKENICAVFITYNPGDELIENAAAVCKQVSKVIIVDNNSSNRTILRSLKTTHSNIEIIENATNLGIAGALNIGIKTAIKSNYGWVLQMDQDSLINNDAIDYICATLRTSDLTPIAMIGINYTSGGKPMLKNENFVYVNVPTLITSGSLLSTEAFQKGGDYRSDYFIDTVDFEYSLRLRTMNYQLLLITKPLMQHAIGNNKYLNLGVFRLKSTNHNSTRRYYRTRNTILLAREYFTSYPIWIMKYLFFLILSILLIILVDNNKGEKLKSVWKGIKDGIFAKLK